MKNQTSAISLHKGAVVTGDDGLRGTVLGSLPTFADSAEESVEVVLGDGRTLVVPLHALEPLSDGSFHLSLSPAALDVAAIASPGDERDAASDATQPSATPSVDSLRIPLLAEKLQIAKRRVETGVVRVTKSVTSREERVNVPVERQEIDIERVQVGQFVAEAPPVRYEGDVMIVPVLEEVLVVEKKLRVREEVRITTRRTVVSETQSVTLRSETAVVARTASTAQSAEIP